MIEHSRSCGFWTKQDEADCTCAMSERQLLIDLAEASQICHDKKLTEARELIKEASLVLPSYDQTLARIRRFLGDQNGR